MTWKGDFLSKVNEYSRVSDWQTGKVTSTRRTSPRPAPAVSGLRTRGSSVSARGISACNLKQGEAQLNMTKSEVFSMNLPLVTSNIIKK